MQKVKVRVCFQMFLLAKLFTHEDGRFFHAHKIFGLSALVTFAYWTVWGDIGKSCPWPTIFIHLLLHVTSFEFILSPRRNRVYNIIWPEMRWHTFLFGARSLVAVALIYLGAPGWMKMANAFATMVLADVVTRFLGPGAGQVEGEVGKQSTTMRGNPFPEWVGPRMRKLLNTFYSMSQAGGTLLIMTSCSMSNVYFVLFPIQTAPFLMTLERKGLIRQLEWHLAYGASLVAVIVHVTLNSGETSCAITWPGVSAVLAFFYVARMRLGVSKYAVWGAACVLIWFLRKFQM